MTDIKLSMNTWLNDMSGDGIQNCFDMWVGEKSQSELRQWHG